MRHSIRHSSPGQSNSFILLLTLPYYYVIIYEIERKHMMYSTPRNPNETPI